MGSTRESKIHHRCVLRDKNEGIQEYTEEKYLIATDEIFQTTLKYLLNYTGSHGSLITNAYVCDFNFFCGFVCGCIGSFLMSRLFFFSHSAQHVNLSIGLYIDDTHCIFIIITSIAICRLYLKERKKQIDWMASQIMSNLSWEEEEEKNAAIMKENCGRSILLRDCRVGPDELMNDDHWVSERHQTRQLLFAVRDLSSELLPNFECEQTEKKNRAQTHSYTHTN